MENLEQYSTVLNIIKKYFSLGKGYDDFYNIIKNNLSVEAGIKEYQFLLSEKDHRKIIKIPSEAKQFLDDGYEIINQLFTFKRRYNITYEDYVENKINDGKQKVKLFKALTSFIIDDINSTFRNLEFHNNLSYDIINNFIYNKNKFATIELLQVFHKYYKPSEQKIFYEEVRGSTVETFATKLVAKVSEKIGAFKIKQNKDLYFIISKNLNDYFLCSYEQGWTSCLNPNSTSALWSCLPYIMTDKNRCILYVSDLEEKEYLGIKSLKMFKRGWGLTGRENDKEGIFSGIYYPSKTLINEKIYEILDLKEQYKNITSNFISSYSLELFYNDFGVYDYMFQDNTVFAHGKNGGIYLTAGEKNHSLIYYNGKTISTKQFHFLEENHTLKEVVEKDMEIKDYMNDVFCSFCHQLIGRDKIAITIEGKEQSICQNCFYKMLESNKLHCNECGKPLSLKNHRIKDSVLLCGNCYSSSRKSPSFTDTLKSIKPSAVLNEENIASGSASSLREIFEITKNIFNVSHEEAEDRERDYDDDDQA
jgi:hypothetical protein